MGTTPDDSRPRRRTGRPPRPPPEGDERLRGVRAEIAREVLAEVAREWLGESRVTTAELLRELAKRAREGD